MLAYDEHIQDVLNELEKTHRFLLGLYAERVVMMKTLTLLMLDKGVYTLEMKNEDIESIEGYGVDYEIKDGVVKMSIQFPEIKPNEVL